MEKKRPTQQYLLIDVAKEEWSVHSSSDERIREQLGGAGTALDLYEEYQMLYDNLIGSPVVFSNGILSQLDVSVSSALTIVARSPLSHRVTVASGMTRFASLLASCGFHSLVLVGAARRQMTLSIDEEGVSFAPSEHLIGKSITESMKLLNLKKEQDALIIGPAGEKEVPYASLISDQVPLERDGFGALLGMKRLKALSVTRGGYTYCAGTCQETLTSLKELSEEIDSSYLTKIAGSEGCMYPVRVAMDKNAASVRHGRGRFDPRMKHLCVAEHPEKYSSTEHGIALAEDSGRFFPLSPLAMLAFGSNIGNYDPLLAVRFSRTAMDAGLDPLATASVISWCMEASERGITDEYALTYADVSNIEETIHKIAKGPADSHLCRGTDALSEHHDAHQFNTSLGGKEVLPVDPRGAYGQALVMALGYDFLLPGEFLSPAKGNQVLKGKGKEVLEYELLHLLAMAFGISSKKMFSLVYRNPLLPTGRRGSLKQLAAIVSSFLDTEYDEVTLKRIALQTLLTYEKVSGRLSASVKVPLQWLIDASSNVEDESTVPFTKLYEAYLHEKELMAVTYEKGV